MFLDIKSSHILVYIGDDEPTEESDVSKAVLSDNHGAGDDVEASAAADQEEGGSEAVVKGLGRLYESFPDISEGHGSSRCARYPRGGWDPVPGL